ncbi:MAG: mannose-1-phosphate guanylyltransferase/mannose-6-phosphate isomerase [Proteobacteria bacterium]|nr:mannose-1-phosphate guanylyltransferase/mannose-6-phosphate isomerase [Pseudomonadota bacterium]
MVPQGGEKALVSVSLYALVLAGGSGTRLWPLSRRESPKQFLGLCGEQTMFEETFRRLARRTPPERMLFISSRELEGDVRDQLRRSLGDQSHVCRVVSEPLGRNTAPAILLGAWIVNSVDPEGILLSAPSDHLILEEEVFLNGVDCSLPAAMDKIITFGITPTRPETGYGYIKVGEKKGPVFDVARFEEKPDLEKARFFLEDKRYLWNSGIFLFGVKNLLEEARRLVPDIMSLIETVDPGTLDGLDRAYARMRSLSFDYGIMEKTTKAAVMPLSMGWSDVGSWDSFYEMREKDSGKNVVVGDVVNIDNEGCLLMSNGPLAAVTGMKDTIVIQSEDAVLVCPRGQSQDVRKIVDTLEREERPERLVHPTVRRPWGAYTVLIQKGRYKVKKFVVEPGQRMSLQKHQKRSEHWVVVKGEILVTLGEQQRILEANEGITIPIGTVHRIENRGVDPAEIVEIQLGDYLGEDDIIRLEDNYGRTTG